MSTLQDLELRGAHEFEGPRCFASVMLLLVLGGLQALERYFGRLNNTSEISAH